MRQKKAGWIKPVSSKNTMLKRWVSYDTETGLEDAEGFRNWKKMPLKLGWALYRNTDDDFTEWFFFTDSDEFLTKLYEWADLDKSKLYVLAHNAGFDMGIVEWHGKILERDQWSVKEPLLLPDNAPIPVVVNMQRDDSRLCFIDLANFFGMQTLKRIGESFTDSKKMSDIVDYQLEPDRWFNAEPGTQDWETLKVYCRRDVEVTDEAFYKYLSFLETEQLGGFRVSLASQAFAAYTSNFMPQDSIMKHDHTRSIKLAREANRGGRTEPLHKLGHIEGPVYEVDVKSMYPAVMSQGFTYPSVRTKHSAFTRKQCEQEMPIPFMAEMIEKGYTFIADVTVDIPVGHEPVGPSTRDGKLVYQTGRYRVALATPELKLALQRGYVKAINAYDMYESRTDLFDDYVNFFNQKRSEYKAAGNVAFAEMCKLFMNAFYGKFGQRNYEWSIISGIHADDVIRDLDMPAGTVGEIYDDENVKHHYRNIGGVVASRSNEKIEAPNSVPSIAAHVTSYGRAYLLELIELAGGRDNVYYCDTDSLMVNQAGLDALTLSGMIQDDVLGKLKVESHKGFNDDGTPVASDFIEIWGPKSYHLEGKDVKMKGIKKSSERLPDGRYNTLQFRGLSASIKAGDPDGRLQRHVPKWACKSYNKSEVVDGRLRPFHNIEEVEGVFEELTPEMFNA